MASKIPVLTLGVVLGIGGPSVASVYHKTNLTIWDKVKDDAIPDIHKDKNDSSLEKAWTSIKKAISTKVDSIKDPDLKSLISSSNENSNIEELKKWCFSKYKKSYWNWFRKENLDLKLDVEKACVQTIELQLENNKITFEEGGDANKSDFEGKVTELQNHDSSKVELEPELIKLKETQDVVDKWKKLRDWCKAVYGRGFQGEETKRWKLVQLYCVKSSVK